MDIEKTMQFILEHQVRFATEIAHLENVLRDTTESMMKRQNEFEESMREVIQTMSQVAISHQRTSAILETLAERQVETEEVLAQKQAITEDSLNVLSQKQAITQENLNVLSQKQAITQESLKVLLLTVERHIAGHK